MKPRLNSAMTSLWSIVVVLFLSMMTACGNSFKAGGVQGGQGGGPGEQPATAAPNGPEGSSFGQRPEENGGGLNGGSGSGSGGLDGSNANLCNGNGEVNVILVFDNSGSQSSVDLQSMRAGASGLLSELTSLAAQPNTPFIPYVSTVRFSDSATIGTGGWVNMKSNSSVATSDVNAATADDGGSTYYVQALSRVAELFSRKQAAASKKNQRNFVVFLSDGAPDDRAQVRSSAQGIADQAGAVFFTVATGGDGAVLQEMAGLVPSSPHPNHRGQYFQAAGQAALATTFRQVGDSLKALCPK